MTTPEFESTPRQPSDASLILTEANATPYIGHIDSAEIAAWIAGGTIRFIYVDDHVAGFGAWMHINQDWCEVGPFFISERMQGQGLGKVISSAVFEAANQQGYNLFAVSKNAAMQRVLTLAAFKTVTFRELPAEVRSYLFGKITLKRLIQLIRKFSFQPAAYYVRYLTQPTP